MHAMQCDRLDQRVTAKSLKVYKEKKDTRNQPVSLHIVNK